MNQRTTGRWAATTNMNLALHTLMIAIDAPQDGPRLVILFGKSGYGKSVAVAWTAIREGAVYLRIEELWTRKTLLQQLAAELGIARPKKTQMEIYAQVKDALIAAPQPLIFDEMDYLVERGAVNVIRDLADATGVPIMMVGEEGMPARLKQWERFDNRIIATVQAMPCSVADGLLLRDLYKGKVRIADDLIAHFVTECQGVTRRVVTNIHAAARIAVDELDVLEIDLAGWNNRPVNNGAAPRLIKFSQL